MHVHALQTKHYKVKDKVEKTDEDEFFSAEEDIGDHKEELDSEENYGRRNKPIYRKKGIENQGCI